MSNDYVTVGCKLPNGVILRCGTFHDVEMPVIGGGTRTVKQWRENEGERYTINGNAAPFAQPLLDQFGNSIPQFQNFALTENIPAEFWSNWLRDNATSAIVKNRLIWAFPQNKPAEGKAMAKDAMNQRHGLEPMATDGTDPRQPKRREKFKVGSLAGIDPAVAGEG